MATRNQLVMKESTFWEIIHEAPARKNYASALRTRLQVLSGAEIISFQNRLQRLLYDAYKFPLLAAAFIIESYVSDDVFENFRCWLVSSGRRRFKAAVKNPESICDWLERTDVRYIDQRGEGMLLTAQDAYKHHGDVEEEFYPKLEYRREPKIRENWPKDQAGFRRRYPRLFDKFWNQRRIREIHGGVSER